MKRALLALTLLAPSVSFAQVGLGVAVDDDPRIFVPIDLTPSFRLEPFLAYSSVEVDTGLVTTEVDMIEIGAGGFLRGSAYDKLQPYVGGRLSLVMADSGGAEDDGFRVEPTFGAEYLVTTKVSVAGEAFVFHSSRDTTDSSGTGTRLVVRFML